MKLPSAVLAAQQHSGAESIKIERQLHGRVFASTNVKSGNKKTNSVQKSHRNDFNLKTKPAYVKHNQTYSTYLLSFIIYKNMEWCQYVCFFLFLGKKLDKVVIALIFYSLSNLW